MWVKTKIAGLHGKRRAWAIPYRGFLIVRLNNKIDYSITHAPSGRAFGPITADVLNARVFIDCLYLAAASDVLSTPKHLDPKAPMAEFIKTHRDTVGHAEQGFNFCWPEIEAKRAKLLASISAACSPKVVEVQP